MRRMWQIENKDEAGYGLVFTMAENENEARIKAGGIERGIEIISCEPCEICSLAEVDDEHGRTSYRIKARQRPKGGRG